MPWGGPGGHDADNHFFGVTDLDNPDNPGGTGIATWTFDITNLTNLSITALFSAMGDFEAGDNSHLFEADIDGGGFTTDFSINGDNDDTFTYTMESGTLVTLNDPLKLPDDLGTRVIDNSFTTLGEGAIQGTGSILTLRYTAGPNNGDGEPFAFDDIRLTVTPVPEPTSMALFGLTALGLSVGFRRRHNGEAVEEIA